MFINKILNFIYPKIIFNRNTTAKIYTTTDTGFLSLASLVVRLDIRFNIAYDNIPIINPSPILYVIGINAIVRKAGTPSVKSEKSIFLTDSIIKNPTIIKAGAVAQPGIAINNGDKNIASKNNIPVTTAASPVLAPDATPAELST